MATYFPNIHTLNIEVNTWEWEGSDALRIFESIDADIFEEIPSSVKGYMEFKRYSSSASGDWENVSTFTKDWTRHHSHRYGMPKPGDWKSRNRKGLLCFVPEKTDSRSAEVSQFWVTFGIQI